MRHFGPAGFELPLHLLRQLLVVDDGRVAVDARNESAGLLDDFIALVAEPLGLLAVSHRALVCKVSGQLFLPVVFKTRHGIG